MKPVVLAIVNGWELAASAPVIADAVAAAEGAQLHLLLWQSREADRECLVPLPLLDFRVCRLWGLQESMPAVRARFLYASTATLLKRIAAMEPRRIFVGENAAGHPHGNAAQLAANRNMQTKLEALYSPAAVYGSAAPPPGLLVEDWLEAKPYWMCPDISLETKGSQQLYPNLVELHTERFESCADMRMAALRRFARRADMLDISAGDRA